MSCSEARLQKVLDYIGTMGNGATLSGIRSYCRMNLEDARFAIKALLDGNRVTVEESPVKYRRGKSLLYKIPLNP